jgi:nitrogen fixation NifU-like protein
MEDYFNLYERLVSIYKNPKNSGVLKDANVIIESKNESCGDEVKIYMIVENNIIKKALFQAKGCVISKASASLLLEYLEGKSVKSIKRLNEKHIFSLIGIDLSNNPVRIKCATLALNAIKSYFKSIE